jgi:hypothetical protein
LLLFITFSTSIVPSAKSGPNFWLVEFVLAWLNICRTGIKILEIVCNETEHRGRRIAEAIDSTVNKQQNVGKRSTFAGMRKIFNAAIDQA